MIVLIPKHERRYEMDYDPAEQLTGAVLRNMTDNVILKQYGYRYDEAGNRAGTQVSTQAGGWERGRFLKLALGRREAALAEWRDGPKSAR